ncbi:hypothetical protein D9619_004991 [Psilocybe cf. subviscida]|uniref:Uncharacterized protein n=1 Tax=Psilocybe cf. subviscida TaxID=2480587 RepID=A0A8H5F8E9_9AGAR|nr:hypothetical protein D9619_004991 [Psilocybe cf. subviscida]
MVSFQLLPPEIVTKILELVVQSSRESLSSFRSTSDPILYLLPSPLSVDKSISLLRQVCYLWNDILRKIVLPPILSGSLDLCVAVSKGAQELAHAECVLDAIFESKATSRLRSIFLKDMSPSHGLLDLFEVIIGSGAVELPCLQRIEIQFGKVDDIGDFRQTKKVDAVALALSQISTLSELYWYSENFISHEIPWTQFKKIFLHAEFTLRTVVNCLEMCTSATNIGIEGIDGWAPEPDVDRGYSSSFVLLPNLKDLILEGEGNIFTILDDLSLPEIESIQIVLRHPLPGRHIRISAAASLQRFMYRHQHAMSITIKVEGGRRNTTDRREYVTVSLSRGHLRGKSDSSGKEGVPTFYPPDFTSPRRRVPKEINDFLGTLIAEVRTLQ